MSETESVIVQTVSPELFETLPLPLKRGRYPVAQSEDGQAKEAVATADSGAKIGEIIECGNDTVLKVVGILEKGSPVYTFSLFSYPASAACLLAAASLERPVTYITASSNTKQPIGATRILLFEETLSADERRNNDAILAAYGTAYTVDEILLSAEKSRSDVVGALLPEVITVFAVACVLMLSLNYLNFLRERKNYTVYYACGMSRPALYAVLCIQMAVLMVVSIALAYGLTIVLLDTLAVAPNKWAVTGAVGAYLLLAMSENALLLINFEVDKQIYLERRKA